VITYQEWASSLALADGPRRIAFTKQNQLALVTWQVFEGSPAFWNPLDATEPMPGSWPLKGNSARVQNYLSLQEGLEAVLLTLYGPDAHLYRYDAITAALAAGDCACSVTEAVARSAWGTWYGNPGAASAAVTQVDRDYGAYASRLVAA
jgi:hypothetical protein